MKAQKLKVCYPSGFAMQVFGRYVGCGIVRAESGESVFMVAIQLLESVKIGDFFSMAGSAVILDPRGLIVDQDEQVIYNPREHYQRFPQDMREFMEENQEWPNLSELKTKEAEQ